MENIENLLHELDILDMCDSIEYDLIHFPEYTIGYGIKTFQKASEYPELLKFNNTLKIRIRKIAGHLKIGMGYQKASEYPISDPIISYIFKIEFDSIIHLHFCNGYCFSFIFDLTGNLLECNYKSNSENIKRSSEKSNTNLGTILINKESVSRFLFEQIEILYPKKYKILMGY